MENINTDTPIISLHMPWSHFILWGWKTIETRTHMQFACLKGRRIGIHSTQKWDSEALNSVQAYLSIRQREEIQYRHVRGLWMCGGAILCTAMVYDFRLLTSADSQQSLIECETKRYGLILRDIVPLNPPIVAKGKQGIWYLKENA